MSCCGPAAPPRRTVRRVEWGPAASSVARRRPGSGASVHGLAPYRTPDLEQPCHQVFGSVPGRLKAQPATSDHGKGRPRLTAATTVGAGPRTKRRPRLVGHRPRAAVTTCACGRTGGRRWAPVRAGGARGSTRPPDTCRRPAGHTRLLRRSVTQRNKASTRWARLSRPVRDARGGCVHDQGAGSPGRRRAEVARGATPPPHCPRCRSGWSPGPGRRQR